MIIDKLKGSLQQNGFHEVKVNAGNIYLYYTVSESRAGVIALFDCPLGTEYTKEQIQNIKAQLVRQFEERFSTALLQFLILTEHVDIIKGLWSEDIGHWIIDSKNSNLIIYENQRADFFGVKGIIENVLEDGQNADRAYNNTSSYGSSGYNSYSNNEKYSEYKQNNSYNQNSNNNQSYDQSNDYYQNTNYGNYDAPYRDTRVNRPYTSFRNYFTPLNTLIVIINVLIFFIQDNSIFVNGEEIVSKGALYWPSIVYDHEYYRVFTYMFLHFGMEHIANNMLVLFVIGNNLEAVAGKWRYVVIYFGSGILAGIASMSYNMLKNTNVVSVGASGAIFGVVGAIAYIVAVNKGKLETISTRQIILFAVFSLYGGLTSQGVDNAAHVGGLLAGIVLAAILYRRQKKNNPERG